MLAGRGFNSGDADSDRGVVIVNQSFVNRVLGGRNAVGRRVRYAPPPGRDAGAETERWYRIVGVVPDLAMLAEDSPDGAGTFLVESDGFEPTALRLRCRVNPWIAVDLAVGALAFYTSGAALLGGSEGDLSSPLTLLAVLAGAAPTLVDFNSGAAYAFQRRAHAVLRPTARGWSALRLKPSSQESVRPVQPDRGVLRRRPWRRQPGGRIMPFTGR